MARQNTGMAPSVFAVLTLLILDAVAMAQIRYGGSGWAQIYHLDYAHHFSQRTFHRSVQAKVFNLPGETTESYGGWINQTGTQVRTGGVEFNFDSSFYSKIAVFFASFTESLMFFLDYSIFGACLLSMCYFNISALTNFLPQEA